MIRGTEQKYRRARLARDARFDGLFFVGVKSTRIYCRSICPATPSKEENVIYFGDSIDAANAGYRPCLRCHPDSAPHSNRWQGTLTSLQRAVRLIDQGALQEGSITDLAERLGISDRYLRRLFEENLGISPKSYALYRQCLFAKQLLHQSNLPITQVALASGFNSVRRFNDCFKNAFRLTPSEVRRANGTAADTGIDLKLYYRPPFRWNLMQQFLKVRSVAGLEWTSSAGYGRTIELNGNRGCFEVKPVTAENYLKLTLNLEHWRNLNLIVKQIRRLFDLDANSLVIDSQLKPLFRDPLKYHSGLRLPGIWNRFEAGVRAILGQQVSVKAAVNLTTSLVERLGKPLPEAPDKRLFPSPQAIGEADLGFLKIPQSRKTSLQSFARWYREADNREEIDSWLNIKGIGPWTVDYVKMRGLSDPDIWLGSDLGVIRATESAAITLDSDQASPWRSYLTFQLWQQ